VRLRSGGSSRDKVMAITAPRDNAAAVQARLRRLRDTS
jgi:hypothetical protein